MGKERLVKKMFAELRSLSCPNEGTYAEGLEMGSVERRKTNHARKQELNEE